ncbi:hypothetical protein PR202_gb29058 [Eleusine coracana subsp. coracana]|uniref:Uncharacterized protein n=1 Tax=Eleusine coracana subsp. coracana TaxID=191504 RepID=A0AAV5FYY2_ELECO|nr:hypothetical protein QOZ80_8BG0642040 [Eleusine coracana subsp. coracana]GJN39905.1 hypothetical protein PR202_gb29058 [Eleusine coracana subsp. coracana]
MAASSPSSSSSSVRQRPATAFSSSSSALPQEAEEEEQELIPNNNKQQQQEQAQARSSSSPLYQALTSTANLANLLPTGTLLAFNLLAPTFTNHGACDATTSLLTRVLLAVLALSCVLASFTDSVKLPDGRVYYGVATINGLYLLDYPPPGAGSPGPAMVVEMAKYRLAFIDFVHAGLSAAVFGVVAARDKNVVGCFYGPSPARETAEVLDILPLGVGVICSLLFVAFPTRRHGIGYPVTNGGNHL